MTNYALIITFNYKNLLSIENDLEKIYNLSQIRFRIPKENIYTITDIIRDDVYWRFKKININKQLITPNYSETVESIKSFSETIPEGSNVLIYFSGHANEESIIFVDTEKEYVKIEEIYSLFKPVKFLTILDCCHSGKVGELNYKYRKHLLKTEKKYDFYSVCIASSETAPSCSTSKGSLFTNHLYTVLLRHKCPLSVRKLDQIIFTERTNNSECVLSRNPIICCNHENLDEDIILF